MTATADSPPIADLEATLLPGDQPVLLLPVRVETAFAGSTLLIRIYPDEIHIDRSASDGGPHPTGRPRLLPDRFLATGWRGGSRVFAVAGQTIDEDALRVAPDLALATPESGIAWLTDFDTAVAAGMALSVELDSPALDRLLVFGVRGALDATATATALQGLLDAHAARDVLGFVAPGEPTNRGETSAGASLAPANPVTGSTAGARTAAALGLAAGAFDALDGFDRDEETVARAMNAALWPATWGYFLAHRMSDSAGPALSADDVEHGRRLFIDQVRAGGPLATLRVGDQPYGLLPVTALDPFVAGPGDLAGAIDLIRRARSAWLSVSATLPRADGGGEQLLEILRGQPTCQHFSARSLLGRRYLANLHLYLAIATPWSDWIAKQEQLGVAPLRAAGLNWTPPQTHGAFAPDAFGIGAPIVDPGSGAFVAWLRDANIAALQAGAGVGGAPPASALIDAILHHATLRAYADAAAAAAGTAVATEPELLGFAGIPLSTVLGELGGVIVTRAPAEARLASEGTGTGAIGAVGGIEGHLGGGVVGSGGATRGGGVVGSGGTTGVGGTGSVGSSGSGGATEGEGSTPITSPALDEHHAALVTLAAQPPEVLTRHFTATMDLCAHRLDAWMTAVAGQRLATLRAVQPQGLRIGAFGWLEGLAAATTTDPDSEGWIAAPSLGQATTAALLRNGYRARRLDGDTSGTLAIDLSSSAVRTAEGLLDGVRQGQALGALLGAQLERALHEAQLDAMVAPLRTYAAAADGAIVDGLSVAQKWRATGDLAGFDFGANKTAMTPLLDALDTALDAVADLTLAEGVHQLAAGNPARAGNLFDALGRGEQPPPETTVATTPRGAVHHAVRLVVALNASEPAPPAAVWPPAPDSVRAAAEPRLEAWAAAVLGPQHDATFIVSWSDASGTALGQAMVGLAALGISALDVLALSDGRLDAWAVWAAQPPATLPAGATASVAAPPALIELAATLRRLLAVSRPATAADLDPSLDPTATTTTTTAAVDPARALAAAKMLADTADQADSAAAASDRNALAVALVKLARFAIPTALPTFGEPLDALRDRASTAVAVARTRTTRAAAVTDASAILTAILDEPVPLLGDFTVPDSVATSAAARSTPNANAVGAWVDTVGRVQPGVDALSDLLLYVDSAAFSFAQLPHETEPSFLDNPAGVTEPRTLTLAYRPTGVPLSGALAALVINEWVEAVPAPTETAGLALNQPQPTSQPAQSCLLAVVPDLAQPWTTTTLEAVVSETLDAAAIRAVPPDALGALAQFLPATLFSFNLAGDAISTDFRPFAGAS